MIVYRTYCQMLIVVNAFLSFQSESVRVVAQRNGISVQLIPSWAVAQNTTIMRPHGSSVMFSSQAESRHECVKAWYALDQPTDRTLVNVAHRIGILFELITFFRKEAGHMREENCDAVHSCFKNFRSFSEIITRQKQLSFQKDFYHSSLTLSLEIKCA